MFVDAAALADAAAEAVVVALVASLATLGRASLALSGGRTPVATYRKLASEQLRSREEGDTDSEEEFLSRRTR